MRHSNILNKSKNFIYDMGIEIVDAFFAVFMVWMMVLLVIFMDKIKYAHPLVLSQSSFIIAAMSVSLAILLGWFSTLRKGMAGNARLVYGITAILFVAQIYIFINIYFIFNADPEVIINCARWIYDKPIQWHENKDWFSYFFSAYNNNLFLTMIYSFIVRMDQCFGILDVNDGYILIMIVHCALSDISCVILHKAIYKVTGSTFISWIFYGVYVILVNFSPYMGIPYSDQMCIAIPIGCVYIYMLELRKKRWIKYAVISAWGGGVGYLIKPIVCIVPLAILFIELLKVIKRYDKRKLVFIGLSILLSVGIIIGGHWCANTWAEHMGLTIDTERRIGWQHFLMMGLNDDNPGHTGGRMLNLQILF